MTVVAQGLNAAVEAALADVLDEIEPKLKRVYSRLMLRYARKASRAYVQQSTVLTAAARPDELYDPAALATDAQRETERLRRAAVTRVLGGISASLSVAFDVSPLVVDGLTAQIGLRARDLDRTMMRVLRSTIEQASQEGWTVPDTSTAIRDAIRSVTPATATMLARTDLIGLANGASVTAAREVLGEGATKTWISAQDDRVRPTHIEADGQTVPVASSFQVGDDLLDYPGDPNGSDEEVINCRCSVVYDEASVTASAIPREDPMSTTEAGTQVGLFTITQNPTGSLAIINGVSTNTFAGGFQVAAPATDEEAPGGVWTAVLAVEGVQTEDMRIIDPGALSWRELPLTLMGMRETSAAGGHDGAVAVGRIDEIWRDTDSGEIMAAGVWDVGEDGQEFRRLTDDQIIDGVSIDTAILAYELRDPETGETLDDEQAMDRMFSGQPVLYAITDAVIGMATVCPFQAIEGAKILTATGYRASVLVASSFRPCSDCDQATVTVVASAAGLAPDAPPAAWFNDPQLDRLTPLTVDDDGRVYGHLADWNVCHTGRANRCLLPPRGADYSFFHAGLLRTADGTDVHVGQITMDAFHADADGDLSAPAARAHYDHTGVVVADVRVGEDQFGPWVAGSIRPDANAAKVRALRAGGKLSGDWRSVNGRYALVAALAVNVPGFPIPRAQAAVNHDGDMLALVASGIVVEPGTRPSVDGAAAQQARLRALAARAEGGIEALARLAG